MKKSILLSPILICVVCFVSLFGCTSTGPVLPNDNNTILDNNYSYKFEVREWGVMVGCSDSSEFVLTSRPEQVMLAKLPIIYIDSNNVEEFGLEVNFLNNKPTMTYPQASVLGANFISWNGIKIKNCDEREGSRVSGGVLGKGFEEPRSIEEMLPELNNVDSDCLGVDGLETRFLFYEGEVEFEQKIDFTYDKNNSLLRVKNNNSYPVYELSFSNGVKRGYVGDLSPGEEEIVEVSQAQQYHLFDLSSKMKNLGFSQLEADSFSNIWNYSFFNSNDAGRLFYLLPESEVEKVTKLNFRGVVPTKVTRALWVLNNVECPKNCAEVKFSNKVLDVNQLGLSFSEIKEVLEDSTLKEENFEVIYSSGEKSRIFDLNSLYTHALMLDKSNILDHLFLSIYSFNTENAAEQFYYSYSSEKSQTVFDYSDFISNSLNLGDESIIYSYSDLAGDEIIFDSLYHKKAYVREESIVLVLELEKRDSALYSDEKIGALLDKIIKNI